MTHDELLKQFDIQNLTMDGGYYIAKAVRAIVELHHPYTDKIVYCQECECLYPCPTIRAIKAELA